METLIQNLQPIETKITEFYRRATVKSHVGDDTYEFILTRIPSVINEELETLYICINDGKYEKVSDEYLVELDLVFEAMRNSIRLKDWDRIKQLQMDFNALQKLASFAEEEE